MNNNCCLARRAANERLASHMRLASRNLPTVDLCAFGLQLLEQFHISLYDFSLSLRLRRSSLLSLNNLAVLAGPKEATHRSSRQQRANNDNGRSPHREREAGTRQVQDAEADSIGQHEAPRRPVRDAVIVRSTRKSYLFAIAKP